MSDIIDEQKKKKLESLLSSSFELFTNKGFSKTTISDIVNHAGVGKGTFYLYFKDKYDVRTALIRNKSAELLDDAYQKLLAEIHAGNVEPKVEDAVDFMMSDILDRLNENRSLLVFMNKNLSWGVFRSAIEQASTSENTKFLRNFGELLELSGEKYRNPEIGLFMIVELVGSTGYSAIMYGDPVGLEELKPYLKRSIHDILEAHRITD